MKSFIFGGLFLLAGLMRADEVAFIAHAETKDSAVDGDGLKSILLGNKTKWEGGAPIKLVVQSEGPVHEKVVRDVTQRSPDQFDKFWKKLVFTGKGMPPTVLANDGEVVAWVAKTPGAFGYVAKANVTAAVKVVATK